MDETETHIIGRHRIVLDFRDDVGPASAYSLLLAENIPDLTGKTAVDLGTGSGILAIVASLQGATTVYLLDTYDKAISLALENGKRNGVGGRLIHLPIGATMLPLPDGKKVDVILSNPAQLPLPRQDRENSPFYAGPDGRSMIDALIVEAPTKLNPSGHLLMMHNSMANLNKTLTMLRSVAGSPSELLQALEETSQACLSVRIVRGRIHEYANAPYTLGLPPRQHRPRRGAAQPRDEFAPSHPFKGRGRLSYSPYSITLFLHCTRRSLDLPGNC